MKRYIAILSVMICLATSTSAKNYEAILSQIHKSDQTARWELIEAQKSGNTKAIIDAVKKIERHDQQNQKIVFRMLDKRGIPENLSNEAIDAIWLVIQHSDLEHIEKYLPILDHAAKRGYISQIQLATMKDRLRVYKHTAQIYGSQTVEIGETIYFYPIVDFENLNARREQIGMGAIEKYIETLSNITGKKVILYKEITFEQIEKFQKQSQNKQK